MIDDEQPLSKYGEAPAMAADPVPRTGTDRASRLLTVGVAIDGDVGERALFALAADKRRTGASYVADFGAALLTYAGSSEAQLFQDVFALFVAGFARDGFFVEVGTGDGRLISNTYLLETSFGWKGLVVEPNPVFLPALRANRSCRIATDCVLDISGRRVSLTCTTDPEFSFVSAAGTQTHTEPGAEPVREVVLSTTSLNDLLTRENCPRTIDYLSIDVEGAEFEILQTFDFAAWDIRCLTVEHNHTRGRDQVYLLLSAHGYVRVFEQLSQWDDWYVHRTVLEPLPSARSLLAAAAEPDVPVEQPNRFVQWARDAVARGELGAATALCDRAIGMDPHCAAAFRTLADIAVAQGRRGAALDHWRAAVAADRGDYWSRFGLAEALVSRGLLGEAVEHLDAAIALDPAGPATDLRETLVPKLSPSAAAMTAETNDTGGVWCG